MSGAGIRPIQISRPLPLLQQHQHRQHQHQHQGHGAWVPPLSPTSRAADSSSAVAAPAAISNTTNTPTLTVVSEYSPSNDNIPIVDDPDPTAASSQHATPPSAGASAIASRARPPLRPPRPGNRPFFADIPFVEQHIPPTTPAPPAHPSNRVCAPDPAKKVTRPNDELHSAIARDALAEQLQEQRDRELQEQQQTENRPPRQRPTRPVASTKNHTIAATGSPLPSSLASSATSSPHPINVPNSPSETSATTMSSSPAPPRPTMAHRTASLDSTVSSVSTNTSSSTAIRGNGSSSSLRAAQDPASQPTAATLIAAAGSAEAALQKVLAERQQLSSHNAQLWRLVEKQRSMLLGLGKDLEKMTKEKERYKKKLKEHLGQNSSISSVPAAQNPRIVERSERDDSQSPVIVEALNITKSQPGGLRDLSQDTRKTSDTSDAASFGPGRSDTPQDAAVMPSAGLPATPQSTHSSLPGARDVAMNPNVPSLDPAAQFNHGPAGLPAMYPPTIGHHSKTDSASSGPTSPQSGMLSSPKTRKAPPAPLNLGRRPDPAITNNIIDASDSEYEGDPDGARNDYQERGRRKTREEDDREREKSRMQEEEQEARSRSKKKSKSRPTPEQEQVPFVPIEPPPVDRAAEQRGKAPTYQALANPSDIIRNRQVSDMPRNITAPSLLSPGLPMSPRPGDRPLGSPMPRAPNTMLNSIPMSPKAGMAGNPLSPRAPRHPIPLPPQTPSSMSYPHLDRAMHYQQQQPQVYAPPQQPPPQHAIPPTPAAHQSRFKISPDGSPDLGRPSTSSDQTPGEVFTGFVSDAYPDLLLPPNALPSIYVKTTSPRMKPSRQSFIAPRPGEDNPVFTLAVYERSANKQLWRVEKTYFSLASLDQQIKAVCTAQVRLPDKTLFAGHAPARMDARRQAIDQYLERILDSVYEERAAKIVCAFLSHEAFAADAPEYFGATPAPATNPGSRSDTPVHKLRQNRSGYLTKRGKNFGGWKARFFVLDGPNLKYFEGPGGAQLGAIKLQNAQIGKQSNGNSNNSNSASEDEENQYRHAFLILEPKKKDSNSLVRHVLCAESDQERDAWVEALLQYVDFKDDEEHSHPGRQAQALKAEISGPRSPRQQKSLNDLRPVTAAVAAAGQKDLRGTHYNDMVAGDAPVIGGAPPLSPRFPDAPGSPMLDGGDRQGSHPNISGPTNLQVISNTGDWGLKPPPTPNARDGNKKRSVFQLPFSNRGRSSSEIGSGDASGSGSASIASGRPSTAVRAVFGVELAQAVEYASPVDVVTELPAVVYRCIEYLTAQNAVAEEGIFRLSGSNTVIKSLKERFNTEGDVNLLAEARSQQGQFHDVHAVASLLKLYLRELPSSILTRELHLDFLRSLELVRPEDKIVAVNVLVQKLPRANRALVEALAMFMVRIVENVAVNRMNVRNLGVVFAPTLNVPGPLISLFVEEKERIFGLPYDEADSPISSSQQHQQHESLAAAMHGSSPNSHQQNASGSGSSMPVDLRSPRKQMFSDLPTPAYNQTHFHQPMHPHHHPQQQQQQYYQPQQQHPQQQQGYGGGPDDGTGMIPLHPSYAPYQMAPQGEGGFGSLNDALRAPVGAGNSGLSAREQKARRRESGMLMAAPSGDSGHGGVVKQPSLSRLREELEAGS